MLTYSKPVGLTVALAAVPALLAAAPAPHAGYHSAARSVHSRPATPPQTLLQVNTGRGRLVTLAQPMSDLFIADPGIADVQVRSPTQLYVFGRKTGETTISATGAGGQVVYAATVRIGDNLDSIQSMLALAMPEAHVVATPMNGLVLLTGAVATPADAAEVQRLTQAFVGKDTQVLSRLKTATPLQVMLQVRISEVSRSFAKNIGSNLTNRQSSNGAIFGISRGRQGSISTVPGNAVAGYVNGAPIDAQGNPIAITTSGLLPGATQYTFPANSGIGTTLGLAGHALGMDLLSSLDLGETLGQVSTLANPNLTALSGETATFLAGGEIPIPISQGLGAVSVEYKQYGISLAFTPTVLSDGRISLRVRPEVSELSSAGAVQLNGTVIPALTTRRVETSAEMGSGESMMIGGLLSNSHDNSIEGTPGLGNVPVLGALFRSNAWKRSETELVIVVTPYLVKPVANAADIILPTDGEKAPTDLQRVFMGKLGDGKSGEKRPVPTMAQPAPPPPAIGVVAPVQPADAPAVAPAADPRAAKKSKKGDVSPGFSN